MIYELKSEATDISTATNMNRARQVLISVDANTAPVTVSVLEANTVISSVYVPVASMFVLEKDLEHEVQANNVFATYISSR